MTFKFGDLVTFLLAYSIAIPAVVGMALLKKVDKRFLPFILILIAGLITEVFYDVWRYWYPQRHPSIPYKAYLIIENLFYLWLFYNLEIIAKQSWLWIIAGFNLLFYCLQLSNGGSAWHSFFPAYILFGCEHLVCAVLLMSKQVLEVNIPLLKNPKFLLALPVAVYFAYVVLQISIAYWFGQFPELSASAMSIQKVINPLCNLFFVYTLLCLPRHQTYSSSSS
ncbi:MAG TPA: hypothetical protein PKD90_17405 [Phnomibacter sp.]|nr:hypothetical protein [Phnomibacter sp.]